MRFPRPYALARLRRSRKAEKLTGADLELLEHGIGLDRARTDTIGGEGPWLTGPMAEGFVMVSKVLKDQSLSAHLDQVSDKQLIDARVLSKTLLNLMMSFGGTIEESMGRWAAGFGFFPQPASEFLGNVRDRAWLVVFLAIVTSDPEASADAEEIQDSSRRWEQEGFRAWLTMMKMAEALPLVSDYVTPERYGKALKHPGEYGKLIDDIRLLREYNADEIDAFFEAHPDLRLPGDSGGT